MVRVITNEEFARETGRTLEEVEAMIAEAEADAITADTMDPSTLRKFNWTEETPEKFRDFLRKAGVQV